MRNGNLYQEHRKRLSISIPQPGRLCMQPHITESVERMEMQRLGASLWWETLLLAQVSSQFIQETKEGPEMKVQTHRHPVAAGGSCQTTPKCCIAPYWAQSLLKWANRLWSGSAGSALHRHRGDPPGAGDPLAAPSRGTGKAGGWRGAQLGGWSSSCLDLTLTIFCPPLPPAEGMQRQTRSGEGRATSASGEGRAKLSLSHSC